MKKITLNEYQSLVEGSAVLEQDRHGIKVLETDEGLIVKIFRQKRLISSALLKPYASRFVANAHDLKALGIKTVEIESLLSCKPIKRTLVVYRPIPGKTLREALKSQDEFDDIMHAFVVFFAGLHDKGVYFRSVHFNNIIVSVPFDSFGLIDFADLKIFSRSLSRGLRLRNFRHLAKYQRDREAIKNFGVERFINIYFGHSNIKENNIKDFQSYLKKLIGIDG